VPLDQILDIYAFDLTRILDLNVEFFADDNSSMPRHDTSIRSIALQHNGDMKGDLFEEFIGRLVRTKAKDLFRFKAIVAIKSLPHRIVFHGIHHNVQAIPAAAWESNDKRFTKMVFIGRNLDNAALSAEFQKCVYVPPPPEANDE